MDANRDHGRRGARALRGGGRALQGRARGHRGGADHALHAGRLHRPLPRPAPPELGADQGDQAPLARGRVLARRRAQPTADAGLRHRLLLAGGPRRVPRADRGGQEARPPPARHPARPLPPLRRLARLAVLAPQGDGALERARRSPPAREPEARLLRGEDAAALRRRGLQDLGPLRELRREHVLRPRRRAHVRAQADELPGPHAPVREPDAQLPRAADPLRGVVDAAPQRARGDAARAAPGPPHHPGRRAHLLHRGADPAGDRRDDRVRARPVRAVRGDAARRALHAPREAPRHRRAVGHRRGRAPRRRSSGTRCRT